MHLYTWVYIQTTGSGQRTVQCTSYPLRQDLGCKVKNDTEEAMHQLPKAVRIKISLILILAYLGGILVLLLALKVRAVLVIMISYK